MTNYDPYYTNQYAGARQAPGVGDALSRAQQATQMAQQGFAQASQAQQMLPMVDPNAINYVGKSGPPAGATKYHPVESFATGVAVGAAVGAVSQNMWVNFWTNRYNTHRARWIRQGLDPMAEISRRAKRAMKVIDAFIWLLWITVLTPIVWVIGYAIVEWHRL